MSLELDREDLLITFFFIAVTCGVIMGLINVSSQRDDDLLKWRCSSENPCYNPK